jgi:phosphatidylserine/phosphatidylglycerophosphate/cardiolipin synthase-like enzyme
MKFLFLLILFPSIAFCTDFTICFTPSDNCTQLIVDSIDNAKESVYVQAYILTSKPIKEALARAKDNAVSVKIVMDKSYQKSKDNYFLQHNIPVWIDHKPAISHNKIMIIDNETVITGSFNFTYAAQFRNAENVLIVTDRQIAELYLKNWIKRKNASEKINDR